MYKDFFGLKQLPFNLTPDPAYFYPSSQHGEALAALTYAIRERKGFAVLTGDAGTGKTTLLSAVIGHFPSDQVQSSILLNPILTPAEFLEFVMLDFGLPSVPASKAQRLWQLQEFLLRMYRENRIAILVIDEAHKLSVDVLEEIRLLGNFEYGAHKFLQIVLLGQCELDGLLDRQDMRQFKQRVALRVYIDPLPAGQIGEYIRFRWRKAGGAVMPFTSEAVDAIARFARGIPRVVNTLCDTALLAAYGEGRRSVTAHDIGEAGANLGLVTPPPMTCRLPADPTPPALADKRLSSAAVPLDPARLPPSVQEKCEPPSFAGYGTPRRNSILFRVLSRKLVHPKSSG